MDTSGVFLTPKQAARDLWEFGEDLYIDRALGLSNEELIKIGQQAYANFNKDFYKKGGKDLPDTGYDIGFISALTLVEYFEGNVRPLKKSRRRDQANLPVSLDTRVYAVGIKTRVKSFFAKFIH